MLKKIDFSKYTALIAFIILFVALSLLSKDFLTSDNLLQVLRQIAVNGLIAGGMTFVILTGGIDLSVGSILGFSAMSTVIIINSGIPSTIAIILGMIIGGVIGMFNGFLVAKAKLQPFIVTLASMTIMRGATLVISKSMPITASPDATLFRAIGNSWFLGIPLPVIILVIVFILLWFLLEKTTFGKKVYSIGGNEEVARLSGIKTDRVIIAIYAIVGVACALAGVILASRLNSAQPQLGSGYELDAIAAVVIGGTSLSGGKGKISGTVIGVLLIGVLSNGLNLLGVQSDYQQIVKGAVILLAVLVDRIKKD
ncbi:ABC transporter permease [Mycoplasma sp. P36-A1]|uniref:ABC transporter permease n=1 Tax=Mycoplasma sp. P36-A1 TaxID=3252900 RepID=UPI003C2B036E